jgi:hypothetical protein
MSCELRFTVSGYDAMNDYTLSPDLTFDLRYLNGSVGYVVKSVEKTFNQISIGSHWCGNQECVSGEDSESCCYDCGCPQGQYCDTQNINGPTEGDGCEYDDSVISIGDVSGLVLQDSSVKHDVNVPVIIENYPSGVAAVPECELAGGDVGCEMSCKHVSSGDAGRYKLNCTLTIPVIDYVASPYYDPGKREIILRQNSINLSITYNDGYRKAMKSRDKDLGNIVINVTSHCGSGSGDPFVMCEGWLGENEANCCRDCGCSSFGTDYFCYVGESPNGECVDNSSILLEMVGFDPQPVECIIGYTGGGCKFIEAVSTHMSVRNAPPGMGVVDGYFLFSGQEPESLNCRVGGSSNITCPMIPGDLSGSEGKESLNLEIGLELSYRMNTTVVLQNVSANSSIEISKRKSQALQSCEDEVERMEEQLLRLKQNDEGYSSYSSYFNLFALLLMILFILCIVCSCTSVCSSSDSSTNVQSDQIEANLPLDSPYYDTGSSVPSGSSPSTGVGVSGQSPPGSPDGSVLSFSYCSGAAQCLTLLTMALSAFSMSQESEEKVQKVGVSSQELEARLEQKRAMCSSEAFGELAAAEDSMLPLSAYY